MNQNTPLTETDIRATVTSIISRQLNVPQTEVRCSTSIQDDLGADSLGVVELIMTIENRYRVLLQEEAARKPLNVDTIVEKLVSQRVVAA